jgi:hypothetical protein
VKAAIREKIEERRGVVAAEDPRDALRAMAREGAAEPQQQSYLTVPAIAGQLGLEYAFVRACFEKLPGVLRIGNGEGRRKKILVPRAVFEAWLAKNTVKEGGERITYKRHRRQLVAKRATKTPISIATGAYVQ